MWDLPYNEKIIINLPAFKMNSFERAIKNLIILIHIIKFYLKRERERDFIYFFENFIKLASLPRTKKKKS